ncbi:MAG: peptide chain release factor 1 [Peptococcaceae bacterium]|nr:peptide chain release factor 1 [Peptococcaceae bacterium]
MLDKLNAIEEKYEELSTLIADPEVMADMARWQQYVKSHAELAGVAGVYKEYKKAAREILDARDIITNETDQELLDMAQGELTDLQRQQVDIEQRLKILLLPKDPNDEKNVIMEIRAGTGGEEAALFAAVLFRMYSRFAENQGWKMEILAANATDIGGFKEVVVNVEGRGAYSRLKFESGAHRVQRIPTTESSGRIHTSAATVAVLPEAEEVDVEIDPNDLRTDVFCASGHGGQSVNTTQSAVRLTHIPTGIVVSMQDEKSQHKNKDRAMKVLMARLYDRAMSEHHQKMASTRKSMVGSGDRSERIRTYNYPQNRVTDHRVGLTLHRLDAVLEGDLEEIIETLVTTDQAELLKQMD